MRYVCRNRSVSYVGSIYEMVPCLLSWVFGSHSGLYIIVVLCNVFGLFSWRAYAYNKNNNYFNHYLICTTFWKHQLPEVGFFLGGGRLWGVSKMYIWMSDLKEKSMSLTYAFLMWQKLYACFQRTRQVRPNGFKHEGFLWFKRLLSVPKIAWRCVTGNARQRKIKKISGPRTWIISVSSHCRTLWVFQLSADLKDD